MKHWFLCFFFCAAALFGADFRLRDRLEKAKVGDYIVLEANKMISLICIRSTSPNLILEEISVPTQNLKKRPDSWSDWMKAKAPGNTSWSMVEIDPQNGQVLECYSFSKSAWIHLSQNESLFATMIHLPIKKMDPANLRRIGPPPMAGEPDIRKIWNPPLVFEGQKVETAGFDVYETAWPQDGSELSGKEVSLYFDKEKRFPFPYWVQVETSHATAALRAIDSGKNLPNVHRSFPRRIPEFIGQPQKTETGLRLSLKSPKYYRQFELFAIDVTQPRKEIYPISYSLVQGEEEYLTLEIALDELTHTLHPNHRYTWLLVPTGHSESYTESAKPFLWK